MMNKMKKIAAVALLATACNAQAQDATDWSTLDKTLLVASTAANMVDWGQTRTIAMHPDQWYETNRLMGRHPDLSVVNAYFISRLILVPLAAHYMPEYRTAILSLWLGIGMGYAGHNHSLGLKMSW